MRQALPSQCDESRAGCVRTQSKKQEVGIKKDEGAQRSKKEKLKGKNEKTPNVQRSTPRERGRGRRPAATVFVFRYLMTLGKWMFSLMQM